MLKSEELKISQREYVPGSSRIASKFRLRSQASLPQATPMIKIKCKQNVNRMQALHFR